MKQLVSLLISMFLISIVLVSCTNTSKLEKLGYNKGIIEEVLEHKYEKHIIENGVSHDKYNAIKEHKFYQKDNMIFYFKFSNALYELDDLDKLIVGVNQIAEDGSDTETLFNSNRDDIVQRIELAIRPRLEFRIKEVNASPHSNNEELIRSVLIAESKFDGNISENVSILSDLKGDVIGEYDVKVEAHDSKGYTAILEDKIKVIDKEPPSIDAPSNIEIFTGDEIDLLSFVTAVDNLDGDITENVVIDKGEFSADKAGLHTIYYKVVDSAGNEGKTSSTINILPSVKFKESFVINNYSINVNSCTFNRTDSEPVDGYYRYYNAGENQIFYICKLQIKNENDIQRKPFDIFGNDSEKLKAEFTYNGKYTYDSVAHRIDNNWYDTFVSLKPLTSNTKNLTFEVPLEVRDSSESIVLKFSSYTSSDDTIYLKVR